MKEILDDVERWERAGHRVAIARVVGLEGSGPRDPGAAMAVSDAGEVAGSVSGGCVEGAVVAEATAVLEGGAPRLVSFGYSDDDAFAVGLTCGGTVTLFVDAAVVPDVLRQELRAQRPVATATVVDGTGAPIGAALVVRPDAEVVGTLGDADLDRVVVRDALAELESGLTVTRHYGPHGEARQREVSVFIESFAPPPRMIVFGAVDFTAALVRVAKVLGFHVTVCDARPVFATRQRFPAADDVVVDWPDRHLATAGIGDSLGPRDAVCVLTHDPKFDVPAVVAAVRTNAGYIGAMGSRRTHTERLARLREAGLGDDDFARLMSPIGLDIGARTPEETAISICAEIIAGRAGRPAPSLRDTEGPIHRGGKADG